VATYTALDDFDLPSLASRYGLRECVAQPMKGGAVNSSFRLDTPHDGRAYVLSALDDHDEASARHLAAVTRGFARLGLPTSQVVANRDGDDVTVVQGRPFLLKDLIAGEAADPLPDALLPAAGELLAVLHGFAPESLGLPVGTRRLSADHRAAAADFPDRDFAAWLDERLAEISRHRATHRRTPTAIHGDLFADNLIVGPDGQLSVIDWETASLDDPLLDLGMAAVGLCQDAAGRLSTDRLRLLVEGYDRRRHLSAEDRAEFRAEIVHAAAIIGFHRYHRHTVRFPDPSRATYHRAMVAFVESVPRQPLG
jgi:aminoglycoside phosphotransferase (APT) family kinase protein